MDKYALFFVYKQKTDIAFIPKPKNFKLKNYD